MAFSSGLRSPQNESSFPNNYASPIRPIGSQLSSTAATSNAERQQLHRRFTTNALPTLPTLSSLGPLSPIGQQRRQAAEPQADLASATLQKIQLLQKRKEEFELVKQTHAQYNHIMEDMHANKQTMDRLEQEIRRLSMSAGGHASEPSTPPEYRDSGLVNGSRTNRLSLASLTSTPGIGSIASPRTNRSGSQSINTPFSHTTAGSGLPSYSVPQSRRGSDEDDDQFPVDLASFNRRPNGLNRNSMPAMPSSGMDRSSMPDVNALLGYDFRNIIGEDDDANASTPAQALNGLTEGLSLHYSESSERFPTLLRRDDVDRADESRTNRWSDIHRHRPGQQSLPMNGFRYSQHEDMDGSVFDSLAKKSNASNRRSMEVSSSGFGTQSKRSSLQSLSNGIGGGLPKLQQSYSTNDIPTVKNAALHEQNASSGANMTHAEQHLHNHNASMGRVPVTASNRQSRDFSSHFQEPRVDESSAMPSGLPKNGNSYNNLPSSSAATTTSSVGMNNNMPSAYPQANGYYGYNMQMMSMGSNGMSFSGAQNGWANGGFQQQQQYPSYGGYGAGFGRSGFQVPDSQRNVMKARKAEDDNARFAQYDLETLGSQIYELCKDQHGCRFLQRKIEERNEEHITMIYNETKDHIVELMTDPFGNYLCQKLLEHCSDAQRTQLIQNAAHRMTNIAVNQHGTRALQKMIEFISTREQIDMIKFALGKDIVGLIQDLNGNHVIQKCLNHLKPEDADFIFNEVALNCLSVGTHRHGCCVLQRCIDHAAGPQKGHLINAVINNAYALVQDPFGNYVVQYILDLGVPDFTTPLCLSFSGRMVELSRQKFSSNVMEKMIRCSPIEIRPQLCEEYMRSPQDVERHIRDLYANYVVQTILDYGAPETVEHMWAMIEPILERVKATPAGRRISNKSQQRKEAASGMQVSGVHAPPMMNNVNGPMFPMQSMQSMQSMGWTPNGHPSHTNGAAPGFF